MSSKDEIVSKLEQLSRELAHARESLLQGKLVTIDNVTERINEQCLAITELEPDDAIEIKPVLDAMLVDFQTFSDEIAYVQNKVEELLAAKRQAASDDSGQDSEE